MKFLIILILSLNICGKIIAQKDSSILKRLNQPIINCETISINSQILIHNLTISNCDSIRNILKIWEQNCGNIEPIVRLQILIDIQQNRFIDTTYSQYILNDYIEKYKMRNAASYDRDIRDIYEQNKAFFDYVKPKNEFDKFTKKIALSLLPNQSKGSSQYLYCLLFSDSLIEFNKQLYSFKNTENFIISKIDEVNFKNTNKNRRAFCGGFIFGFWQPIGKMSSVFHAGVYLNIQVGLFITKRFKLEGYLMVQQFGDNRNFEIMRNDSIKTVKAGMVNSMGFSFTSTVRLRKRYLVDCTIGFGSGMLDTDLKKISNKSDNSIYERYGSYDTFIGFTCRKRIFTDFAIGLNVSYHYAPYNFDSKIKTNLGNQYISTGIIFNI